MARTSPALNALRAQLSDKEAALAAAKKGAARARDAAADAAQVWPELAGAAVAGGLAGAGIGYEVELMGVALPVVPLAAGVGLMVAGKRGGVASRAGRGMLIAAGYELAAQIAGRGA